MSRPWILRATCVHSISVIGQLIPKMKTCDSQLPYSFFSGMVLRKKVVIISSGSSTLVSMRCILTSREQTKSCDRACHEHLQRTALRGT